MLANQHKNRLRGSKGVTLVEVMMAVFIFIFGIQGLLGVYLQSMQVGKKADYTYTAYNLAKNHVERLKTLNYALLPSVAETSTIINSDGDPDPNGSFIRSTTVTANFGGNALLTQVTVQVNYIFKGTQSSSPTQFSTIILNQ